MEQLFDLTGHVALVTGGNGGIGLGMAEGLAANGAVAAVAETVEELGRFEGGDRAGGSLTTSGAAMFGQQRGYHSF